MWDRGVPGWLVFWRARRAARPFFAFLNYNDALPSPYEVPDRSVPGFGLRPTSALDRRASSTGTRPTRRSSQPARCGWRSIFTTIAASYLDRRLGILLDELSRARRCARQYLRQSSPRITASTWATTSCSSVRGIGCLYRQLVQVLLVIVDPAGAAGRVVAEPAQPARFTGHNRRLGSGWGARVVSWPVARGLRARGLPAGAPLPRWSLCWH